MAIIVKMGKVPTEFKEALPILQRIEKAGYEAYFVGGSVRDTLLNRPIHDVDIATSAYPSEVKELFKRTVDTGIEHGTVMILDHGTGYEVTTFRTESGYQDYRRPDKVKFVRSLKEDLKRRDFTINALAMSESGQITDLFGGLADMKAKIIRAVGDPDERFNEDALRMMRAIRFASQLDFQIEAKTLVGIKRHSQLLEKIAVERTHTEFVKMMTGRDAENGLDLMVATDLYQHMPGLTSRQSQLQRMIQSHFKLINEVQVWSLLAFYFNFSSQEISQFLKSWKTANKIIDDVILTTELLFRMTADQVANWDLYRAGRQNVTNAVAILNTISPASFSAYLTDYQKLPITDKKQLKITGGQLIKAGILKPSPELGKVLNYLEKAVVQATVRNDEQALINATTSFINEDD
ncbi:CCA tRNA nucleotidyltransferase [Lentilactobacillus kisonensis]|uniref:CCA-adding enzyme n=1 Tax=Lentilactobacillus kisonensis DSM 19906 = JCM 15041 TaxID=1423766 RepID=A0A0R1NTF5_9LACO|nr:CCA tRNA nucleotidyltransferase [Lentilactobacillus kisonensis]KRL23377.1 tRNA adenylyltransferase [Lentilactobacillus kisonensis DSM 19906 = JCM 15041]